MNAHSIKFRLVVWYASVLTGIFLLLCVLLYLDLRTFLEHSVRDSQLRRAHQLANALLTNIKETGEAGLVNQIKVWYAPESNARFIRLTRADGSVAYVSAAPTDGSFAPADVPMASRPPEMEPMRKEKLPGGNTLLIVHIRFQSPGNPEYFVECGSLLNPVEDMLRHLFLQLALGLPLAVGITTAGGYLLLQRALRPVEQITHAAEQITQLNLSERLPVVKSGDELEQLATALNRMIARLDDAFQNSKRFIGDASHDLRTPLTILRGELESLVEDPQLDEALRHRLASLLEDAVHLSKIVEQLFTLTQLDSVSLRTNWTQFDLAELARSTADQLGLLAEDKQISLVCTSQPTPVQGDRSRIKQVLVNLLDNAIKYTLPRGKVEVRVATANGHAILEVEDSGIGISATDLPHVFERFYRVDQARPADAESAGLGLAIVKAICSAHGAEVTAWSEPGVGSRFTVKIPRPSADKNVLQP